MRKRGILFHVSEALLLQVGNFSQFSKRCKRCHRPLSNQDVIMKARECVYHIQCFNCIICGSSLQPGELFALGDNGSLYCQGRLLFKGAALKVDIVRLISYSHSLMSKRIGYGTFDIYCFAHQRMKLSPRFSAMRLVLTN